MSERERERANIGQLGETENEFDVQYRISHGDISIFVSVETDNGTEVSRVIDSLLPLW